MDRRIPMGPGKYGFHVVSNVEELSRTEIKTGIFPDHPGLDIEIKRLLSKQGSTCLVYEGALPSNGRKVIIKEFYPCSSKNVWGICRDHDQQLKIPCMVWRSDLKEENEINSRLDQFLRSYEWQKKFYSDSGLLELVAEPQYLAVFGDTYYIISDFHNGLSLKDRIDSFSSLKDKIYLMTYLADVMMILEENHLLFLDICPDNFLVIRQTEIHYQIRLFDMDSIIDLKNIDNLHDAEGSIYYHEEYAPGEIRDLHRSIQANSFEDIKKDILEKSVAVYSLGILFFRILFGHVPDEKEKQIADHKEDLSGYLVKAYDIPSQMADQLVDLLRNMLSEIWVRYQNDFSSCRKVLDLLKEFSAQMDYETYITRTEMANANDVLSAYNMLQKYPLFRYADQGDGKRLLKAAFVGNCVMRSGFLSSFISVGQMLHTELDLTLLSSDAEQFWKEYISENHNIGLVHAVRVDVDGKRIEEPLDQSLVSAPLADIHIINRGEADDVTRLYQKGCRYFVFLTPETETLKLFESFGRILQAKDRRPVCIGCLQTGNQLTNLKKHYSDADIHMISGHRYNEIYNENMVEEQIYKMGFMAHAYYCGFLDSDSDDQYDIEEIEKNYKADIYSRMSSERAALHGIYKMESIGVDSRRPGRFRTYFSKLKDESIVETLACLEHRSWTAYMLTAGHTPVPTSELDAYAYQGNNDWKDKENQYKLRHPLLVTSEPVRKLPENGWQNLKAEEISRLDPLDKVSYDLYQWYCKCKPELEGRAYSLTADIMRYADETHEETFEELNLWTAMCLQHMCERQNHQEMKYVKGWSRAIKAAEQSLDRGEKDPDNKYLKKRFRELREILRIVADSYKNRDFKQFDRDIVYSVLDIIAV